MAKIRCSNIVMKHLIEDRLMFRYISKVSKQELYFVKEHYEIFSAEVSAREKQGHNSGGPHQGVTGSLRISSVGWPF